MRKFLAPRGRSAIHRETSCAPPSAVFLIAASAFLAGCTSLLSHNTLHPYTKNKFHRAAVEQLAENYCRAKRRIPGATGLPKTPDYLFTTDGCSRFPDDGWTGCCVVHDIAYWCGGSEDDREEADRLLRKCVNEKADRVGDLMYLGVRLGGSAWWPTPWRWGYGWDDWPRGYEDLNGSPPIGKLLESLDAYRTVERHLQK